MSREILFRGKRLDNSEWVYGFLVYKNDPVLGLTYCFIVAQHDKESFVTWYKVGPATVGQYTGKTVKTGKVFEGDIGRSIDGLFLVCWDEEMAAFVMRFTSYPYETLHIEELWDDAEIIGNIHDNQEPPEEG